MPSYDFWLLLLLVSILRVHLGLSGHSPGTFSVDNPTLTHASSAAQPRTCTFFYFRLA